MNKITEFLLIMGLGLVVVLLITGLMLGMFKIITYFGFESFPFMFGVLVLLSAFMIGKIILKSISGRMIYIIGFILIILIGIVLPKYIEEEERKYQDEDDEY